ncbi:hypothetical protein GGR57DRAFT_473609 [Xylariaceae sp. FL1272]|nr:hypothetical protein GGR57DRAFT_473609 [Xylariaceae sp. FL1272]
MIRSSVQFWQWAFLLACFRALFLSFTLSWYIHTHPAIGPRERRPEFFSHKGRRLLECSVHIHTILGHEVAKQTWIEDINRTSRGHASIHLFVFIRVSFSNS